MSEGLEGPRVGAEGTRGVGRRTNGAGGVGEKTGPESGVRCRVRGAWLAWGPVAGGARRVNGRVES